MTQIVRFIYINAWEINLESWIYSDIQKTFSKYEGPGNILSSIRDKNDRYSVEIFRINRKNMEREFWKIVISIIESCYKSLPVNFLIRTVSKTSWGVDSSDTAFW